MFRQSPNGVVKKKINFKCQSWKLSFICRDAVSLSDHKSHFCLINKTYKIFFFFPFKNCSLEGGGAAGLLSWDVWKQRPPCGHNDSTPYRLPSWPTETGCHGSPSVTRLSVCLCVLRRAAERPLLQAELVSVCASWTLPSEVIFHRWPLFSLTGSVVF